VWQTAAGLHAYDGLAGTGIRHDDVLQCDRLALGPGDDSLNGLRHRLSSIAVAPVLHARLCRRGQV
jgi:hypothetical protein